MFLLFIHKRTIVKNHLVIYKRGESKRWGGIGIVIKGKKEMRSYNWDHRQLLNNLANQSICDDLDDELLRFGGALCNLVIVNGGRGLRVKRE